MLQGYMCIGKVEQESVVTLYNLYSIVLVWDMPSMIEAE